MFDLYNHTNNLNLCALHDYEVILFQCTYEIVILVIIYCIADKSVMDDVDSNSGTDDEWEGIEEEVELSVQTKCIFCSEIFNNAELMFDHCRSQHMFDVVSYCRRMNLNCIGYIKFINYMRAHVC